MPADKVGFVLIDYFTWFAVIMYEHLIFRQSEVLDKMLRRSRVAW